MVSAHLAGSGAASLTAVELSSGGASAQLSSGRALFRNGRLRTPLGAAIAEYQLTAGGLEQRFIVDRALSGNVGELTLRFRSPERWRSIRNGSAIVLTGRGDSRLAYAGLRVTDAHGRMLASRFAITSRGPEIVTDTKHAAYPITIDPTWTTTTTPTVALNLGHDDGYVTALSADGTTALVGADGAAYIFHASAEGSWSSSSTPVAVLTDGADSSDLELDGASVALSSDGTTALIGDAGAENGQGLAYLFHVSSETSWASSSNPTARLAAEGRLFGSSVALSADGTTALIGATGVNGFTGAAYVFQASAEDAWTSSSTSTVLTNSSGSAGDQLGSSVSLSSDGTTALIGDAGVNDGTGAAYVFEASAETAWASSSNPTATLTDASGSDGDGLGFSAALSSDGTTAVLGAAGVNSETGAAYVFQASAENNWQSSTTPTATLSDSSGTTGLGESVALSGNGTTALVGADNAADVFHVSAESSWDSSSPTPVTLTDSLGDLGAAVALSSDGTAALIGAPSAAYTFYEASGQGSWAASSTPGATLTGPSAPTTSGDSGYSVALSSDGTTALVGASGAAFVFHVSAADSWASSASAAAVLTEPSGDDAAAPVALSADGTTALIGDNGANSGIGVAYVFHVSSASSWVSSSTPTATLTDSSGFTGGQLGSSVSLSSDGTTALVGAPNVQVGANGGAGAVYVFQASAEDNWQSSTTPAATLTDGAGIQSAELGASMTLSSDGTTALIGAPGAVAAYVFQVPSEDAWAGPIATPAATLTNSSASGIYHFAGSVALSQDGTTALLGDAGAYIAPGAAYVYHVASESSWTGSITAPTATLTQGSSSYDNDLGNSVALSSDGTTAVIGANGVSSSAGAAYVFQVSAENDWATSSAPTATLTDAAGAGAADQLGSSVALSSDGTVALIGAYRANNGAGGAYVFSPASTTYTVTTDKRGSGVGTVTSADDFIDCGSTCTADYGSGSQVTLFAAAGLNSEFTGWSGGGCSGTGSCVVTLNADTTVTATFTYVAPPKSLTVSLTGTAGSVSSSPAGISCPGTCGADFSPGTVVTLTATPGAGSRFAGWSGPACKVTITGGCSVTSMVIPQTVTATFTAAPKTPPHCTLVPSGGRVALTSTKPLHGSLKLAVHCDQSASAKLTGLIAAVTSVKSKTFTIPAISRSVSAGKTYTVIVALPQSALAALKAGARESVSFTLRATNVNGVAVATAKIAHLKLP